MSYPNMEAEMARRGLTRSNLADTLGTSLATIHNWMNDRRGDFSIQDAIKVQRELFPECGLEYLFEKSD